MNFSVPFCHNVIVSFCQNIDWYMWMVNLYERSNINMIKKKIYDKINGAGVEKGFIKGCFDLNCLETNIC